MRRQIQICSKDVGEVEAYVSEVYAPVAVSSLGESDEYGVVGSITQFDGVLVEWSRTIGNYKIDPLTEFDAVIFNMLDVGSTRYHFSHGEVDVSQGSAIAYRNPKDVELQHDSVHTSVAISNALLQKRLSVLLDGFVPKSVEFVRDPLDFGSSIEKFTDFITDLRTSPLMAMAGIMQTRAKSVAKVIVDGFLLTYPNNCSEILAAPVPTVAPKHVKRALDYIHSHPHSHIGPETLAKLSSVSVRSLQYSFRAATGQTITEYQHFLRLRHAREELLAKPDLPLKVIAEIWGFGSLARFGHCFKKTYGVSPSALRREKR